MIGRTWTLELRAPTPIRSSNASRRMHWGAIARERWQWRTVTQAKAREVKLPTGLDRVLIDAELRFPTRRHRDAPNYHDALKPAIDALGPNRTVRDDKSPTGWRLEVGHGLIPDDTPGHLDGPHITFGELADRRRYPYGFVVLTITDLSGGTRDSSDA